jgi:hypothetical protein
MLQEGGFDSIKVLVKDTGTGIQEKNLEKMKL